MRNDAGTNIVMQQYPIQIRRSAGTFPIGTSDLWLAGMRGLIRHD